MCVICVHVRVGTSEAASEENKQSPSFNTRAAKKRRGVVEDDEDVNKQSPGNLLPSTRVLKGSSWSRTMLLTNLQWQPLHGELTLSIGENVSCYERLCPKRPLKASILQECASPKRHPRRYDVSSLYEEPPKCVCE